MTPNEFKAWFDGFTEAFAGCPTKAQWTRIKERVAEIDGKPVTERVYIDRYLPSVPYYAYAPYWRNTLGQIQTSNCSRAVGAAGLNQSQNMNQGLAQNGQIATNAYKQAAAVGFDSAQAMTELGRAEAASLKKAA